LDRHLASLRFARNRADRYGPPEVQERIAATLRRLVLETTTASAVDRARVRAAVHYFMLRGFRLAARNSGGRKSAARNNALWNRASLTGTVPNNAGRREDDNLRVINELLTALGREDLAVTREAQPV
jgi:hypothetical protein